MAVVHDAAFAVGDSHDHGLVPFGVWGIGRGQHLHVFRWATEVIVEFVLGVFPLGGHALGDGVFFPVIAKLHDEFVLRSVVASGSRAIVPSEVCRRQ